MAIEEPSHIGWRDEDGLDLTLPDGKTIRLGEGNIKTKLTIKGSVWDPHTPKTLEPENYDGKKENHE